ncbi:hypothetical protein DFH08DRAFT_1013801 [Mycena albidolilacea]|uniref:DUF6534 domain-containing protein n=1 Tax=Mycena albidolilacea TaxID=1033008 RepID=A0AAD6ZTM0_9AGAR|nr:hypothetical protein DFH08DRAFT_1013801 [Mycena albidolilacea]
MNTAPPATVPIPAFNHFTTIGSLEIGIVNALFLSGIFAVQVFLYFQRHREDRWGIRFLVGLCGGLDVLHTIALCHALYTVTVTQYGNPESLLVPPMSLDFGILLSGFIGPLEQGWFTYRLHRLTKRVALPFICLVLTLARFVGLIGLSIVALHQYSLPEYNERASWIIESVVIVSAALDFTLVTALCYHLRSWRPEKSRVMHKIVNQIMIWTAEAGAVTMFGALGILITYLTMKNNYVYIGFFVVQPKLFSNSLLLSLNSRGHFSEVIRSTIRNSRPPASMMAQMELSMFPSSPTSATTAGLHSNPEILGIKVDVSVHSDYVDEGKSGYGERVPRAI